LKKGLMKIPSKAAIAYYLIEEWFNKGNVGNLSEIVSDLE